MRLQTSLEFLFIIGIIGGLSIAMLTTYKNTLSKNDNLLSGISLNNSPKTLNFDSQSLQNLGVAFYLPSNSTLNRSNLLQIAAFGCNNGHLNIYLNSTGLILLQNKLTLNVSGLSLAQIYFSPSSQGYGKINVNYTYLCGNFSKTAQLNLTTYSSYPSYTSVSNSSFATISNRAEYLSYNLVSDGQLMGVTEFAHCTYAGLFGPTGINSQCGTTDAWEYSVFSSSCYSSSNYYTQTYCIVPYSTNYNSLHPDPFNYSYKYSFLLDIYSKNIDLKAKFSNNSTTKLKANDQNLGYAQISRVSGISNLQNIEFILFRNTTKIANSSAYFRYSQSKNNLYSSLSFYNNTEVSSDVQSSLESSISSYSKSLNNLINSTTTKNNLCSIIFSSYNCNSTFPLSYNINVNITGGEILNSTLSYQGSIISLKGG